MNTTHSRLTNELKPIQIDVLNNTLGYLLAHNEADKEVYKLWKEYFEDCQQFNRFKVEYSRKGIQCGCLVYSASETGKIFYAGLYINTATNEWCSPFL